MKENIIIVDFESLRELDYLNAINLALRYSPHPLYSGVLKYDTHRILLCKTRNRVFDVYSFPVIC